MFNFKPSTELSACLSSHRLGLRNAYECNRAGNSLITLCLWGVWSPNTSLQKHRHIFFSCDVLWEDKSEQLLMSGKSLSKAHTVHEQRESGGYLFWCTYEQVTVFSLWCCWADVWIAARAFVLRLNLMQMVSWTDENVVEIYLSHFRLFKQFIAALWGLGSV